MEQPLPLSRKAPKKYTGGYASIVRLSGRREIKCRSSHLSCQTRLKETIKSANKNILNALSGHWDRGFLTAGVDPTRTLVPSPNLSPSVGFYPTTCPRSVTEFALSSSNYTIQGADLRSPRCSKSCHDRRKRTQLTLVSQWLDPLAGRRAPRQAHRIV